MGRWFFPSAGYGNTEGLNEGGLETFKGNPIRSLAREVCQNSLDAALQDDIPVKIEFEAKMIKATDFPGMDDMKLVLAKCKNFWANKDGGNSSEMAFVKRALKTCCEEEIFLLRISDYNTTGLRGAFNEDPLTPWGCLVKGSAFSAKQSNSSAGSYGIGKAAPFVVSELQTVFYRTLDTDGVQAAQGVTHLVSFELDLEDVVADEDRVRRSIGYYSNGKRNQAFEKIEKLDAINRRTQCGTDLFIPAFHASTEKVSLDWKDEIIIEILDNFLYSIYSGKLEVVVDDMQITKHTLDELTSKYKSNNKSARLFLNVICDNPDVKEVIKPFYDMGLLRLRVLYHADANRKVLVVRKSGMKITTIPRLPKGIAFVAFLELQGDELNYFFRKMENPQHNKWEPNRHEDPKMAKRYKEEVEQWVRDVINEKAMAMSGPELDIDVSSFENASENDASENDASSKDGENAETISDTVNAIEPVTPSPSSRKTQVQDIGGSQGQYSNAHMKKGDIDDRGPGFGHRSRSGMGPGGMPTGRRGTANSNGKDNLYEQMRKVDVSARFRKLASGVNRLMFTAAKHVSEGELKIVSVGDNGKSKQILVKSAHGINVDASVRDGHIVISNVDANIKYTVEFEVYDNHPYAMEVKAYGN